MNQCIVCKTGWTECSVKIDGVDVAVCHTCLNMSKRNFIFICMGCGAVHIRDKDEMIARASDEIKRAYATCYDMQLIQGINKCVSCDPVGIVDTMEGNA